jgi:hypothetical protein
MRAILYSAYGSPNVVQLEEVEDPIPKENEVLIRVRATTVSTAEMAGRKGDPFIARLFTGLRRPKKIPGSELAGNVKPPARRYSDSPKVTRSSPRPVPALVLTPSTSVSLKTGPWQGNRPMRPMRKPSSSVKEG